MPGGEEEDLIAELAPTPYEHVTPIARGGMSSVHLVRHRALGHEVVMKLLGSTEHDQREELTRRLLREGRVLRNLRNEHLLRVIDFGFTQSMRAYLITEPLAGNTLKAELQTRGTLPISEAVDIAEQALDGLIHAHAAGVVHRDLKPENILWLDPDPGGRRCTKILDFGIVKILDVEVRMKVGDVVPTVPGQMLGTPAYAPPEQIAGEPADARSDLYALGGVLFFLLTGRGPFVGKDVFDMLQAHIIDKPKPPSELRPDVPPWLDAVVLRALAKDRRDRFSSAREMLDALKEGAASTRAPARPVELDDAATQPLPLRRPPVSPTPTVPLLPSSVTRRPAHHAAYRPTLYKSSPLKQSLARAAEGPGPRTTIKTRPEPAHSAVRTTPASQWASRSAEIAKGNRPVPRDWRARYVLKVVLWIVLMVLAAIGLLRLAGVERYVR